MATSVVVNTFGKLDPMLLAAWEPVLAGWGQLMDRWVANHPDQYAPYSFNKQASVGLLASAIARAYETNLVIHEFPCVRVDADGKSHSGRADLRAEIDGLLFELEARFLRVSCRSRNPLFRKVPAMLKDAKSKLTSQSDKPVYFTSAVFAVPYAKAWSERSQPFFRDQCLEEEVATRKLDPGIRADYYPETFPEAKVDPRENGRHPGAHLPRPQQLPRSAVVASIAAGTPGQYNPLLFSTCPPATRVIRRAPRSRG